MGPPTEALTRPAKFPQKPLSVEPTYVYYGYSPYVDASQDPKIYDGDTPSLIIDLGCCVQLTEQNFRLWGINTPEIKVAATKAAALAAKAHLIQLIKTYYLADMDQPVGGGYWLAVRTHKHKRLIDVYPTDQKEKFGRFLVELFGKDADGKWVNLNQRMITDGFAVEYLPE